MHVTKGLFIKPRWIELILAGRKTWEMRSMNTAHRGWFGLIGSGTGRVWGVANLIGVGRRQTVSEMLATFDKHQISEAMIRSGEVAKWNTPWIIGEARRLPQPIVSHAKGQLWVNLEPAVTQAIGMLFAEAMAGKETMLGGICSHEPEASCHTSKRVKRSMDENAGPVASAMLGETELTKGNTNPKNSHFYMRAFIHRFPTDLVGGSNESLSAQKRALVDWGGPSAIETDIDGEKKFFRKRSWVKQFFADNDAEPGDRVRVEETAPYRYRVSLHKKGRP